MMTPELKLRYSNVSLKTTKEARNGEFDSLIEADLSLLLEQSSVATLGFTPAGKDE